MILPRQSSILELFHYATFVVCQVGIEIQFGPLNFFWWTQGIFQYLPGIVLLDWMLLCGAFTQLMFGLQGIVCLGLLSSLAGLLPPAPTNG